MIARHRVGAAAGPFLLALLLLAPALWLTLRDAFALLPPTAWPGALLAPNLADPTELLARHSFAPRIAISILAGGALGLAGFVLQEALRNPLADPTTLGTSAGAGLALTAATVWAPGLLEAGREPVALAGAALATALTFALVAGRSFSPLSLVLAGLLVTLVAGSAGAALMALKSDDLAAIFVWQSGSLIQNGDAGAKALAWQVPVGLALALLLLRPLQLLGLGDRVGASLGLSPGTMRLAAVALGVCLSATVAAAVGVVAFVGLAAPALARLAGARRLPARLGVSVLFGALVLWLADRLVASLSGAVEIPAGAATAVLGAPLILILLPLLRRENRPVQEPAPRERRRAPGCLVAPLAVLLAALAVLSFVWGRGPGGWEWLGPESWGEILPFRGPRIVVSAAAGALLATAGTVMQRLTGNPMASPELLGASGGATLGILALMTLSGDLDRWAVLCAAAAGAGVATLVVILPALRGGLRPERLILSGFFVATLATSCAAIVLSSGDPRIQWLKTWLSGSTYRATAGDATTALAAALLMALVLPAASRWLGILPLGAVLAKGLGTAPARARLLLLLLAAAATATATVVIGPLSFVGLMAPHMARMLGFQRPLPQAYAAAMIGAATLCAADWIGRNAIYPWQVPAGLLAALIGAPAFAWAMRR